MIWLTVLLLVTENGIAVNSYFAEHPEMMLGSMEYDTRIYGQDSRYTVCVNNDENFNMYEALNKAIGNIKAQMTDFERVSDEAEQETGIQMANSPTQTVGYPAVSRLEKTRHEIPLLSLDKTKSSMVLLNFMGEQQVMTSFDWGRMKVQLPSNYATILRLKK